MTDTRPINEQYSLCRSIGRLEAWIRDYGHEKQTMFIEDLSRVLRLADAYLAEHPADDDEPVTEEWLLKVGRGSRSGSEVLMNPSGGIGYDFSLSEHDGAWHPDEVTPPPLKTRGDVRRLCEALGITLTADVGGQSQVHGTDDD